VKSIANNISHGEQIDFKEEMRVEVLKNIIPKLKYLVSILNQSSCPPILLVICRLLRELYLAFPSISTCILLKTTCQSVLGNAINIKDETGSLHTPFSPILWKECLIDLLPLVIQEYIDNSLSNLSHTQGVDLVNDDGNTCKLWSKYVSQFAGNSLAALLILLWHPISEIREGVLCGCEVVLNKVDGSLPLLMSEGLMKFVLLRAHQETEPPLLQMTISLICQ
jgi:hypothetical protein